MLGAPTELQPDTLDQPVPPAEPEEEAQPYGPFNRDLPQQLIDALSATIREFQQQEKYTRRLEVLHDRKLRFYERGYQHISWNNTQGAFTLASPGSTMYNSAGQSVQCPTYIDDYNIFFPYLRILTSVLTQNPPGISFQPIDPSVSEDIDGAKEAEGYTKAFDRYNDIKALQTAIVRMMGVSGRVVSWTRTDEDGQKFGYNPDGSPKKFQRTTIHGTLETKVPLLAREFDAGCLYCFIYDDPDIRKAKDEYPWKAANIKANQAALGESAYERTARIGVLNGTRNQAQLGDSFTHLVSRLHAFIRPAAFTGDLYDNPLEAPEEGDVTKDPETGDSRPMTVGEKLRDLFPEGVRACYVGDVYVGSAAESMDDHIEIQWPYEGDGMFRAAFMDPMVVVQDNFNDMMNGAREEFDTGWGAIWFNAEDEDLDAVRDQKSAPNAIRGFKLPAGQAMRDGIYEEKGPDLPASFVQFLQMIQGELPQFMLAAPPALFGDSMEDQKTASGYAQARSQAMGQLGVIWGKIQRMFARIRYQAALAAANCEDMQGEMTVPGSNGQQSLVVNLEKLRKGNFGCYPDEDSNFPESTPQKRATLTGLLTAAATSPLMTELLNNPDNIEEIKRLNGFEELVLLPAEARNKQLWEIEQLLQSAPLPPSPQEMEAANVQHAAGAIAAQQNGQPAPPEPDPMAMMEPSIPVDELDFHQWEFEKCQEWLSSAARRQEEARGNKDGILNVKLHALEHRKFVAMAAAAAAPPPMPAAAPKKPPQPAGPPPAPAAPVAAPAI